METDIDFYAFPVKILRPKTRSKLSCMLNKPKVLLSSENLPRDYRGLADLMNVATFSHWFRGDDYVEKLLSIWSDNKDSTLGKFQSFLEKIDRYDVLDDTYSMFVDDAVACQRFDNNSIDRHLMSMEDEDLVKNTLTIDDVWRIRGNQPLQRYDAFILYVDEDQEFAREIINTLESEPFHLKLCDKDRDLIPGVTFEHDAIMKLISERCNRLIVIFSTEFLRSDRHTFFLKFAQALAYENRGIVKVIPCIYKACKLPDSMRAFYALDRRRCDHIVSFWKKLHTSILTCEPNNNELNNGVQITEITDRQELAIDYPASVNCDLNNSKNNEIHDETKECNSHTCQPTNFVNSTDNKHDHIPSSSNTSLTRKCAKLFGKIKKKRNKPAVCASL